jgi:hypothetical protein
VSFGFENVAKGLDTDPLGWLDYKMLPNVANVDGWTTFWFQG